MDNKKWFSDAKFGMMIHWGLYSIPAGEWQGRRTGFLGEWIQSCFRIPNSEYQKLAGAFNPIYFNAEEWVKLALDAGMKYIVFTSKHHDGFAMFHSKVSAYNVYDATPFKRDVVGELAEACCKYGLKLGLYYSQALDWHEHDGGGYEKEDLKGLNGEGSHWCNDWDYPENDKKDYSRCFEEKIKLQVKEILTNYGDLCLIWFDVPKSISLSQSRELYDMVKKYQPNCLINSRIGNGLGDYTSTGDNEIPDDVKTCLYESPATINDTWGYKTFDNNWKSVERLAEIKKHLNDRGINYLLNVGPDYLGRIPAPSVDILRKLGGK